MDVIHGSSPTRLTPPTGTGNSGWPHSLTDSHRCSNAVMDCNKRRRRPPRAKYLGSPGMKMSGTRPPPPQSVSDDRKTTPKNAAHSICGLIIRCKLEHRDLPIPKRSMGLAELSKSPWKRTDGAAKMSLSSHHYQL